MRSKTAGFPPAKSQPAPVPAPFPSLVQRPMNTGVNINHVVLQTLSIYLYEIISRQVFLNNTLRYPKRDNDRKS